MRSILIVNQSTVVNAADFAAAVAACQRQVNEHFGPAYGGLSVTLTTGTAAPTAPHVPTSETIYILDTSDQAGALGYHETVADVPVGYVFAKTSEDDKSPWQTTLSHEMLEQIADPFTTSCAVVQFQGKPAAVEFEVCDPVENDSYLIDNVPVSNFVLPAWFQSPDSSVKGPFDYLGKLSQPLTLTAGGYVGYTQTLRRWKQLTASMGDRTKKYHRIIRRRGEKPAPKAPAVRPVEPETFVGGKPGRRAKPVV